MDYTIYSEEEYYEKIELLSIYNATVANCIWEEIIKYRELYKHELNFQNRVNFITLNQTLFYKILKVYDTNVNDTIHNLKIEAMVGKEYNDIEGQLIKYIKLNQIEMNQTMLSFLLSNELFVVKVYIIFAYIKDLDFLYLFLYLNKKQKWYIIISEIEGELDFDKEVKDITKQFRNFLEKFYIISNNNMVELKSTVFEPVDINELISLYPMCNRKQLTFYLNHCKKNHYYTIQLYMELNNVSYETARKAMEQLETLQFYNKLKIGKKFVFTPIG